MLGYKIGCGVLKICTRSQWVVYLDDLNTFSYVPIVTLSHKNALPANTNTSVVNKIYWHTLPETTQNSSRLF
jgi:hypothetical protein